MFKKSLSISLIFFCTQASFVQAGMWSKIVNSDQPAQVESLSDKSTLLEAGDFPSWADLTPARGIAIQKAAVERAKAQLKAIAQLPAKERNFQTVYREYDRIMGEYADATTILNFIHLVRDLDEWEDPSHEIADSDTEFLAWVAQHDELKDALMEVGEVVLDRSKLDSEAYFVYTTLLDLEEAGSDLDSGDKERLRDMLDQLSDAQLEYDQNLIAAQREGYILVKNHEKELLEGLPDYLIEEALELAIEEGEASRFKPAWLFVASSVLLNSTENEALRKRVWTQLNEAGTKAPYDNGPLIDKILRLREEMATLLGHDSFADLEAEKTMVASSETAVELIQLVQDLAMPHYKAFMSELLDYINKKKGEKSSRINPWDAIYYVIQRDVEQYHFDESEFWPYYPYEHVRDYCFKFFGELYGLRIEEAASHYVPVGSGQGIPKGSISVWDPRVQVYKVYDEASGDYMGAFYLDAFARDEKSSGAWSISLQYTPKLEALVVDIEESDNDEPDLLTPTELHNFVHELGHVLHFIMSDTELTSQSADQCAQDFVEMPSQLFEQWLLDRDFMKALSKHVETGKPIPDKLLNSYIGSRASFQIMEDIAHLQEVKLDLEMHLNYSSKFKGKSLDSASRKVLEGLDVPMSTPRSSPIYGLESCISGGYNAKYYSYLWSNILVSDIFSVFQKKGLSNREIGLKLRREVLSKGASIPSIYLIESFLGREIEPFPYFKKQGYTE